MKTRGLLAALALLALAPAGAVRAQEGQTLAMDRASVAILVRGPLTALDQASKTGNYTVLRDLGGASFRINTAARLSQAFAYVGEDRLDLSPALALDPVLTLGPLLDEAGRMRLAGVIPSYPRQINFEIVYEAEDGVWSLYGLAVSGSEPTASPSMPVPGQ